MWIKETFALLGSYVLAHVWSSAFWLLDRKTPEHEDASRVDQLF